LLNDIFINSAILVAVLSIGTQLFREKPLTGIKPVPVRILTGVLIGLLGCILMIEGFHINSKVMLDFRNIPIIFAATSSGIIASATAAAVIGTFRILYFGMNNASLVAFFVAIAIGTGCGLICRSTFSNRKKWTLCVIYALLAATIGFILNISDPAALYNILIWYWITTILMSIFIYYYIQYLYESGNLYRRYRDEFYKDFLTKLNNVRHFDNVFNEIKKKMHSGGNRSLSLLYLDIDFFKKINDTYGHIEGDIVLKEFGNIIRSTCHNTDLIFRNGGEEFSVLLPDSSAAEAVKVAERIRAAVAVHKFSLSDDNNIGVTVSIGVSSYPDTINSIDTLLEEADNALYSAKRSGRNRVVLSGKRYHSYTYGEFQN
jgi:diguanylate cyclase